MNRANATAYIVRSDGWVAGVFLRAGDVVQLSPEQAEFENVRPVPAPAKPAAPKAPRKTRARSPRAQS